MLRHLSIRDFVIVDRLELEFTGGFGALTGETGAGKSILLDALGLALGGKAEAGVVRTGQARAEIVAEFDLPAEGPLKAWLAEQELDTEEGCVLLRRVIESGGRSKAWLNGSPVVLAQLRAAGDMLADIHGQHAHHALLRTDAQLALVDAHGGLKAQAQQVAERYRSWAALRRAREAAEEGASSTERERELLGWQVAELRELAFDADEWQALNLEQTRLAHAAGLIEGAAEALDGLADGEYAVVPQVERLLARVAGMAQHDAQLADVQELLAGASIQLDEALHALRRYRDRLDLDPARLAEIDQRIQVVTAMARARPASAASSPESGRSRSSVSSSATRARSTSSMMLAASRRAGRPGASSRSGAAGGDGRREAG